ncbi:hypothetical protein BD626DRAFT_494623 [Schizophyllum amplum]|uniref:Uncharacterized protein n=1 Tax=Schizophyllum amplum TaxID=97359 RepID=A0A550CFG1_9AGAR|nr:hypothetical protein BD626DRAFT_494623 [Auriculariopsis ampla]
MPRYTPTAKKADTQPQPGDEVDAPPRSRSQSLAEKLRRAFTGRPTDGTGNPELQVNAVHSSGRGGAGNIGPARPALSPAEAREEEELAARGRQNRTAYSTGRGGAGNIARLVPEAPRDDEATLCEGARGRPMFRTVGAQANPANAGEEVEDALVYQARGRRQDKMYSTGRGGVGNISASRSKTLERPQEDGASSVTR